MSHPGHSSLSVHPIGLGCLGMSQFYRAADDDPDVPVKETIGAMSRASTPPASRSAWTRSAYLSEAFAPGLISGERYAPAHASSIT